MRIADDPERAGYYIELDLLAEAERTAGKAFADYLRATYVPTEPLFRLAEQTGVVLLNGGGFDGPEWSVRVSLANLDDLDYLKIGHHLKEIMAEYHAEWQAAGKQRKGTAGGGSTGSGHGTAMRTTAGPGKGRPSRRTAAAKSASSAKPAQQKRASRTSRAASGV
jgi:hypothetical protein